MNGNHSDETRVGTGPAGQAPDVTVAPDVQKALYGEAMAIRERFEQLKIAGPEGKAERDRLRQRYQEIDRLITLSRAQAKEGAKDGGTRKAPGDAEEWSVGDAILDRYAVKAELGEGGMGKVFRVHDRDWGIDLAVKSPKASSFQTETQKENFVRECHTWMDLGLHNHIVTCHYVRVLGGIPRVFAEYVRGGSLKDWIDEGTLYEGGTDKALERVLDIAIQFAMGLHYAHEKGLVHQDIKPANVMMTPEGMVKLTDFGLANARAVIGETVTMPQGASVLASYGGMTPAYCSPEQADNAARRQAGTPAKQIPKLTRRTDLYSWAVSVLEMFTGAVTWQVGNVAGHALESYLQHGPGEDDLPAMPAQLADLLRQCLQQDPNVRPHDMNAVANALRGMYETVTGGAYPRETPKPAAEMADVLNNKAVSFMELDMAKYAEQAESLWRDALILDAHHPEATYNLGLSEWRTARIPVDELIRRLQEVCTTHAGDWRDAYLLGMVHLESGDREKAVQALKKVALSSENAPKVQTALAQAYNVPKSGCICVFEGHSDRVSSVCLSADGHWALTGSWDKTLRLWDLSADKAGGATGQCVRIFDGHTQSVLSVCLSGDGRWALSGSQDETLRLWEVATGRCVHIFEGHEGEINSVRLSTDGRWALSGSNTDGTLRLWEVSSGRCAYINEHVGGIVIKDGSFCLSADGLWYLSIYYDNTLRMWDASSERCLRSFEGHSDKILSVCLSVDGRWALSGSDDKTMRLWEVATGRCVRVFVGHGGTVSFVCLSTDGHWALSDGEDDTQRLWEVATGRCVRVFTKHEIFMNLVVLNIDSRLVFCSGEDNTLRLWQVDLTSLVRRAAPPYVLAQLVGAETATEDDHHFHRAMEAAEDALAAGRFKDALAQTKRAQAIRGHERTPEVMDLRQRVGFYVCRKAFQAGWQVRVFKGHAKPVNSVCFSMDRHWALSGSDDKTLCLWDVAKGHRVRVFEGHTGEVRSVCLSADNRWALSGSGIYHLRLWDVSTSRCIRIFEGHGLTVSGVSLSADGRWALSGGDGSDRTLRLWEVSTGRCLRLIKDHTDVRCIFLSADGRMALSGERMHPNRLRLWEVATGKCVLTFEGNTSGVNSVCLSGDGLWVLSGSGEYANNKLRLWEVATGKCVRTFEGHTGSVNSVCLSGDGRWALSGSSDKTLRLWDVATGKCARTFEGHTGSVNSVCFSVDGRWAVSGSDDKTLRLWELDWDYEVREPADWNEGARLYLENFLTLHTPYAAELSAGEPSDEEITRALTREGKPTWTDDNFKQLLDTLAYANYGWLRPEGVRRELEKMAANWTGPPQA